MKRTPIALALLAAPAAASAAPFVLALAEVAGLLTSITVIKGILTVAVLVYGATSQRRKARKAQAAAKAAYNASLSDRGITVLGAGAPPWRIVRGRATVGCEVHAIFTTDKQGFRDDGAAYTRPDAIKHLVCVFADHESHRFHDLLIDGVSLGVLDVNGRPTSGEFFFTRKEPRIAVIGGGGSVTVGQAVDTITMAYTRDGSGEGGNFTDVTGSITLSGSNLTINGPAGATVEYQVNADLATVRVQKHLGSPGDGSADTFLVNALGGAALSTQFNTAGNAESWTAAGVSSSTVANGYIGLVSNSSNPTLGRTGLSFAGSTNRTVRARIRRTGAGAWEGTVFYSTGGHGFSGSFYKTVTEPTYDADGWAVVEWDMGALTAGGTDWTSNTITGLEIHLGAASGSNFDVDWIDVVATTGTWALNDRLMGKTHAVVSLDLENVRFQGGPPGITADLSGRKLYDPRKDSTNGGSGSHRTNDSRTWEWSDNAALHVRDEITAPWGHEAPHADVNDTYTIAAANACDVRASASVQAHSQAFTANAGTDLITFASAELYAVGDGVRVSSSGTLPAPLAAATTYYIVRRSDGELGIGLGDRSFALATSVANAYAGVAIDITSAGTGTHTCTWHDYATYKVNGASTTDQAKEAVLEDLAEAMAGTATYGAKWEIQAGAWAAPVMDLTDDDLHGQIEFVQADVGLEQLVNSVRGQYIPQGKATATEFDNYSNGTLVSADGRELWADLALPFTDSKVRARNLSRIRVETSRNGQIIKYPAKLKAWPLQRGDRFRVTSGEYGLTTKTYRCTDTQFGVTSPVVLIGQEDDSAAWDQADQASVDQTPNTDLPSPWVVQQLTLGTPVADETTGRYTSDGTWIPRIKVTWSAVTGAYLADGTGRIVVRWRTASSTTWQQIEVKSNELGTHIEGVREGSPVVIDVFAINGLQQRGPSAFTSIYVDVTGNGVIGGGNLVPNSSFEVDAAGSGLADGWTSHSAGTTGAITFSRVAGFGSTWAQRIEAAGLGSTSSDQAGIQYSYMPVTAGKQYWAAALYTDTSVDLRLTVVWYDASFSGLGEDAKVFAGQSGTLTRMSLNMTAPANATWARIYVWMHSKPGGPALARINIDQVQFQPGSMLTEWAPRADELLPGVVTTPIIADEAATYTDFAEHADSSVTATIPGGNVFALNSVTLASLSWVNDTGAAREVQIEAIAQGYVTKSGGSADAQFLLTWTGGTPSSSSDMLHFNEANSSSTFPRGFSEVRQVSVASGATLSVTFTGRVTSSGVAGNSATLQYQAAIARLAVLKK